MIFHQIDSMRQLLFSLLVAQVIIFSNANSQQKQIPIFDFAFQNVQEKKKDDLPYSFRKINLGYISIESGKLADLIILDKNPNEDIKNTNTINMVMKNGRLYNGNSLDEIYPRVKKAGPFYWNDDDPVDRQGFDTSSDSSRARAASRRR